MPGAIIDLSAVFNTKTGAARRRTKRGVRRRLAEKLTAVEIAEAERRAEAWRVDFRARQRG